MVKLMLAIMMVESGGDPDAIGDNGKAYGCMQIHQCVVDDVNEYADLHFKHKDAFDILKARKMFQIYMMRYANPERLGRVPTMEDMARIWNGGPNGYKKPSTEAYWQKVKKVMEETP